MYTYYYRYNAQYTLIVLGDFKFKMPLFSIIHHYFCNFTLDMKKKAKKRVVSKFQCTQQQLYSVAEMYIRNLNDNLEYFYLYKPKYNLALIAIYNENLVAAMATKRSDEIKFDYKIQGIELVVLKTNCCKNFQSLKRNIIDAFPKKLHAKMFNLAGGKFYRKATNKNWIAVAEMNDLMSKFITKFKTRLLADYNMNSTFQVKVINDGEAFDIGYKLLLMARQTAADTDAKIRADNLVYKMIQDVSSDARQALCNHPELLELFIFTTVKGIISEKGNSDYKLTVKKDVEFTAIVSLKIIIQEKGFLAILLKTNANGK